MVFSYNLIHCDLHPGNILVSPSNKLVILDCGICSSLSDLDRVNLKDLFRAVVRNKGKEAGYMIVDRSSGPGAENVKDREAFAEKIEAIVDEFHSRKKLGLTLGTVKIGELLEDVMTCCRVNRVRMEPKMSAVVLSTIVLEGVARELDGRMNLFHAAMPFLFRNE